MHTLLHSPSCCLFCSLLLNKSCLYLNRVVFAPLRVSATSVVLTFKASLSAHVPVSLNLFAVYRFLVSRLDSVLSCCCYAPSRSSVLSVALTFNASPSARTPSPSISLPVFVISVISVSILLIVMLLLTSEVQYFQCCVDLQCLAQCTCSFSVDFITCHFISHDSIILFCAVLKFCTLAKFSSVNVWLTFNASPSARAPSPSILLPV